MLLIQSVSLLRAIPFWTLFWVLVCLHQLYFGWFLLRSDFVPYVLDGNETFSVWWHSHNLYTFSFWKSFGLTDESYGLSEASHPFFHTHQGNMPRLFGFLIYALGARTVEAQVLVTTLVIGNLTLFFCYASVARISRPIIAFVFCLFLFSDYLLYAQWHVVTYRVWYAFLFFGTLFAIANASTENRIWPYVLLGGLFFLLFYFELVFAGYVSIIAGLVGLWLHWGRPKRIAALYGVQFLGLVAGVGLLYLQLVMAMGVDVVQADFSTTFLARNASAAGASVDTLEAIASFFRKHNIVFWMNFRDGTLLRTLQAYAQSLWAGVFQIWTPAFFVLVATPFIAVTVSFLEKERACLEDNPATAPGLSLPARVLAWFGAGQSAGGRPAILMSCLGLAALASGMFSFLVEVVKPGAFFGILLASRGSLIPSIAALLATLFVASFFVAPAFLRRMATTLLLLTIFILTAIVIFEVSWPPELAGTLASKLSHPLVPVVLSAAALAVGHRFIPSLLPVLRAVVACLLCALLISNGPALYNQNYSEIWSINFENWKVRLVLRLAELIVATASIAIAFLGARRSFGPIRKASIGRALSLFFIALAGYTLIYVLSPGYVLSGYVERLAPFGIFFLAFIPAISVCAIAVAAHRCWTILVRQMPTSWGLFGSVAVLACLFFGIATILLLWLRVQIYYATVLPPNHMAFAKTLSQPPFRGAPFAVNNYAAVVAYYTRGWAYMDSSLTRPVSVVPGGSQDRSIDQSYQWFADWASNDAYRHPEYYACMKMPTFDSVLARRDPARFGHRFIFCDSEKSAWESSPFNDRIVAEDAKPSRFWSVVSLGAARPRIDDISVTVRAVDGAVTVDSKLAINSGARPPATSNVVELLVDDHATCDQAGTSFRLLESNRSDVDETSFRLPANFAGRFMLRAKARSSDNEGGLKFGEIWIRKPDAAAASFTRCPVKLVEGPFAASDLFVSQPGWGAAEPWGVWTVGRRAELRSILIPPSAANSDFILSADVRAFVAGDGKEQAVALSVNGQKIANWTFSTADWRRTVTTRIPSSVLRGHPEVSISFSVASPVSPASLGLSADSRLLGIGLEQLTIKEDIK